MKTTRRMSGASARSPCGRLVGARQKTKQGKKQSEAKRRARNEDGTIATASTKAHAERARPAHDATHDDASADRPAV
jgi:hypothetical protein